MEFKWHSVCKHLLPETAQPLLQTHVCMFCGAQKLWHDVWPEHTGKFLSLLHEQI